MSWASSPARFTTWVKQVLDQAEKAFERSAGKRPRRTGQGPTDRAAASQAGRQERGHLRADGGERQGKKSQWGTLKGVWVPHDTRDEIVDYIKHWTARTELPAKTLLGWLGLGTSKFHQWKDRYGKANEHNGQVPRDWWLEDWEKQAILDYHDRHPLEGYRRLTFMMLDDDVVAVSPSSVYRVLKSAGRLDRWNATSLEERDRLRAAARAARPLARRHQLPEPRRHVLLPVQPAGRLQPLHRPLGDPRDRMTEQDVETIVQRALEKHPGATPRIISDNGPQFIAKDFKTFIRLCGHDPRADQPLLSAIATASWNVGTAASSGSAFARRRSSRWRKRGARWLPTSSTTTRSACTARSATSRRPTSWPGLEQVIFAERDRKLEEARERRKVARKVA